MEPVRLPRGIDDPPQILLWSADELLPFLGMLIVGVLTQRLALCALFSLLVIKLFRRFRDSRPDRYLYHAAYWSGPTPLAGYSLVNLVITVALARNVTAGRVTLTETTCADPTVAAVAAWPQVVLEAGQATELYLVTRRPDPAATAAPRPSLLGGR